MNAYPAGFHREVRSMWQVERLYPAAMPLGPGRYLHVSPVSGGNSKQQHDDSAQRRWIIQQGIISSNTPHTSQVL